MFHNLDQTFINMPEKILVTPELYFGFVSTYKVRSNAEASKPYFWHIRHTLLHMYVIKLMKNMFLNFFNGLCTTAVRWV